MSDNKTIAKNTIFLYFRMILVMGVSLYTSRIVLKELGIYDYGIYSLVGGFITLFGFLNAAMSSATQRYLIFDLGKKNFVQLKKTFNITLIIHIAIAVIVLLLAETVGLWYINYKMVFPIERTFAVNVVYQFSIAASLLGIIQVPFNALIIAHERMNVYAYVGIAEVVLKLVIVFLLVWFGNDKLITYSILTFFVALSIQLFYQFYCRKHYSESQFQLQWDKVYYKELISYSGWSLFGNLANVGRSQGSNLLLNIFFGTIINSAYGLAMVVRGAVYSFVTNFQIASKSQIIQKYARKEFDNYQTLLMRTSLFSFFLIYLIGLPVLYNIDYILNIWLVEVPEYTSIFIIYSFISVMIDSISEPLIIGIHASGRIKIYQVVLSVIFILSLPISYIYLKLGHTPEIVFKILIIVNFTALIYRLFSCSKLTGLNKAVFLKAVVMRIVFFVFLSLIILMTFSIKFNKSLDFIEFIIQSLLLFVSNLILVYFIGLSKTEKVIIKRSLLNYIN